ncbi:hypothetical protein PR202_gb01458 [Eleusine coracana subsp. coracana]|uniref:Uncharacterized protein n=1 Tax=Eleusine coracana subsp. coracana TaxID=191504 RepID=A0AAV5DVX7_ELECO|nr:hypothetical protein PR202_gb01458 [Eleusine coracana subsp. coracana]
MYIALHPSASPCKVVKKSDSSLRRALSPISSNVNQQTSESDNSSILLEPKTPVVTCNILEKIPAATPLDKFNALGSTLKVGMTLVYFITMEELQQLKGIGVRRAEYILELREDSPKPFKSVSL